jgi:hypothetical protein
LNQPCCAGLTVKMEQQVTQALRPTYDELVEQLPAQAHLGMDESPTKEGTNKAWLWTPSAAGSRFVETLLTTIETCRQQNRSVFDFVTQAVAAHFAGQPAPSLLPRA